MPDTIELVVTAPRKRRLKASRKRVSGRPRQIPLSKLKKTLEALQKQIVIQLYGRDCFTCSAKDLQGANCQLGHVPWPRSVISTQAKFRHEQTRIQCFNCNIRRGGMGAIALRRMQNEGIDTDAMWDQSQAERGKTVPRSWFEEKILKYQTLLK